MEEEEKYDSYIQLAVEGKDREELMAMALSQAEIYFGSGDYQIIRGWTATQKWKTSDGMAFADGLHARITVGFNEPPRSER